jgi:hypothetical protein
MIKWTCDSQIAFGTDPPKPKERASVGTPAGGQVDFDTRYWPDLAIDLNDPKTYLDFTSNPNELRERLAAQDGIRS